MSKSKAISILSGGLDSSVATAMARRELDVRLAITFDYGQKAAQREIECAGEFCRTFHIDHRVIELPWLRGISHSALIDGREKIPLPERRDPDADAEKNARSVWVPARNSLFVSIAASVGESMGFDAIVCGFNAEEARTFPDNSTQFIDAANEMLKFGTLNRMKLAGPVSRMTKVDIAKKFFELDLRPDLIWSCYDGRELMCGLCESCLRTRRAFDGAGLLSIIEGRFLSAP
jgi:7-cyano-7-deazaguanine synthase